MKVKRIYNDGLLFFTHRSYWAPHYLFLIALISSSLTMVAQNPEGAYPQIKRMEQYYSKWLDTKDNAELFVEYDPDPLAVDILNPRFSWLLDIEGRNRLQSAYHIIVSSDRDLLDRDEGNIWDTGIVESNQSVQVRFEGKKLESNREYFWKVRIRDEMGRIHPWSKTAKFNTGLLKETDWTAKWIGKGETDEIIADVNSFLGRNTFPELIDVDPEPRSPLFRHEFTVEKNVRRARLFIAGLGLYELSLNGKKVGNYVLTPSKTDFRERILYDTYDVTDQLINGNNVIGVMLGNGWFNGQKKYWGWQMQWYGSPRLILQMEIEYTDGSISRVVSDSTWKSSWGPVTFNCIYDGEHYDARLEEEGWDLAGFDDRSWTRANIVPSPGGKLASAMHEPGMINMVITPVSVNEPRPDTFVYDLGQNFAGWIRMKLTGPKATEVKFRYAEQIFPDGMIDPSSSRAALQEDHYILKGSGTETYEPRFTYHGFQYVEVTGYLGSQEPGNLQGCFVHAAVNPAGSFSCSNDLINLIHLCTVQSQRSNIQMGVPTDDTQRPERLGWGGDALMTSQEAMLNMNMAGVYTKWFRDFRDQQLRDGLVGSIVPRPGIGEDLVWSSSFVLIPWYQYIFYGDTTVLEENYLSVLRYLNYLAHQGSYDIKPRARGSNPLFDELPGDPHLTGHLQQSQWGDHLSLADNFYGRSGLPLSISTAFYYRDIEVMEKIAHILGKNEHAEKYNLLASEVRKAFNDKFLSENENYYDDGSQSAQVWPLYFEIVPKEIEQAVINYLIDEILIKHDGHPTTGYIGTKYMLDLLSKIGRDDIVWEMALKTDFPGWAYSLRNGRTTITEAWTDGGSKNHVVLGAAIDKWFYNVLAGINPDENYPGFKRIIIKPYIPEHSLDWVDATIGTLYGEIRSSWNKKEDEIIFEFMIPANTSAEIHIPLIIKDATIFESGKPVSRSNEVRIKENSRDEAVFEIGSGEYQFVLSGKKNKEN